MCKPKIGTQIINLIEILDEFIGSKIPLGINSNELQGFDLRIEKLESVDADFVLLDSVKYLLSEQQKSGQQYKQKWNVGWGENLAAYLESKQEIDLIPKYITKNKTFRIMGDYYSSPNPFFEVDFARIILLDTLSRYVGGSNTIVDIGSGSCHYTLWLAKKFENKTFFALDWVNPSLQIAGHLARDFLVDIRPEKFDMFEPRFVDFGSKNKLAISIGALEQLGTDFEKILIWFKDLGFETIINIEPIVEFYDENILYDFVAKEYVIKRNWLNGYFARIKQLSEMGEIEILEQRRVFGSKFHETYNILVWKYNK